MNKLLFILGAVLVSVTGFSQEGASPLKKLTPSRSISVIQHKSEVKEENKINLQQYVEQLYRTGSAWHNDGALPTVAEGEYVVALIDKDGKYNAETVYSKDLLHLKKEEIKSVEYRHAPELSAIYGSRGGILGMVFITLK